MKVPEKNMVNSGIIFMFTVWLQGQMSDLLILKNNPELISDFVKEPKCIPEEFYAIRVRYWEKQFGPIKNEFNKVFFDILTNEEKTDLEEIYHLRNMIAHAQISIDRNYMLYRPFGGTRREQKIIDDLKLHSVDNPSEPTVFKVELWREDKFLYASNLIERFEKVTLKKVSNDVGIPHSRIR